MKVQLNAAARLKASGADSEGKAWLESLGFQAVKPYKDELTARSKDLTSYTTETWENGSCYLLEKLAKTLGKKVTKATSGPVLATLVINDKQKVQVEFAAGSHRLIVRVWGGPLA